LVVYVTQHGQMDEITPCGTQEYQLSALGRRQAAKLGYRLKELGFAGRVLVSPFHRCLETAQIICEILGLHFFPEAFMCEIASGWLDNFRGLKIVEIRCLYGACAPDAQLAWPWWPTEEEPSESDVLVRLKPYLDQLVGSEHHDVLLVGHAISAGAAFQRLSGEWGSFCNTALGAVQIHPDRSVLWYPNTSHLGPGEVTQNSKVVA
jgi:broad specificity phosphatase PhoE